MGKRDPDMARLSRLSRLTAWLPTLVALAMLKAPSFDILDYHCCLVLSPIMGLCAGSISAKSTLGKRSQWLLLMLGPVGVYVLNSLFVPWCAPMTGLGFYALGPLCSVFVGACMGVIARAWGTRWGQARLMLIATASTLPALWHFYWQPQVFAYQSLFGWVAGALYEDNLDLHSRYLTFRLINTPVWLCGAAIAHILSQRTARSSSPPWQILLQDRRAMVALSVLLSALFCWRELQPAMGWRLTKAQMHQILDGRIHVTPAPGGEIVVAMSSHARWRSEAHEIADDLRHVWIELSEFFGQALEEPVQVFIYRNARQKQELMGAHNVEMAKPWLRQIHLVWPGWGRSIVRHELAHVFAGQLCVNWLGVPLRNGLWPDPVLIEGVAVAAEWPVRDGLTPHQWSAAMHRLGLAPSMSALFEPTGFFQQSSARSYTIAGSFLRWFRDTYGELSLRQLMQRGSLSQATDRSLEQLSAQWEHFLEGFQLTDAQLHRASARFQRSGLFFRPCSLEIGRCRERARKAWRQGDDQRAVAIWGRLKDDIESAAEGRPIGLDVQRAYAFALGQAGQSTAALEQLPQASTRTSAQLANFEALRADLVALHGDFQAAKVLWRRAASEFTSEGWRRMQLAKIYLSNLPEGRRLLRDSWLRSRNKPGHFERMRALTSAYPDDPMAQYLSALWRRSRGSRLGADLCKIGPRLGALKYPLFADAAMKLCAIDQARAGQCRRLHETLATLRHKSSWARWMGDRLQRRCKVAQRPLTYEVSRR